MAQKVAVIVGAGQAGGWVARTLRSEGFGGRIVLIGEESHPPYERPPLSKGVLAGQASPESTYLFTASQLAESAVEWWPAEKVAKIDVASRSIQCASGKVLQYHLAFLTTGGDARELPALPPGPRVHYLRNLQQAQQLRGALRRAERVLVVGGGWIGLEVAATARQAGKTVSLVESGPRLCGRSLSAPIAEFLANLHRQHGVALHLNAAAAFTVHPDGVLANLPNGTVIEADVAVVGIGMQPRIELAKASGLAVDNGIAVDMHGRTSAEGVYAAGDVASFPAASGGGRVRLESWANAQNTAVIAAKSALGLECRYDELPWFWSDQFDVNLQVLGHIPDGVLPIHRDYGDGRSTYYFVQDQRIRGVVAINSGRDIKIAKRLISLGVTVDAAMLRDVSVNLQKLPA